MPVLTLDGVSKSFGSQRVIRDLSFAVEPGEIFGLLGPNGAGKTTTIRMMLDLLKPDAGAIEVFGGRIDERKKDRIGYMPEERGLYSMMTLMECLTYLGALKSLSWREAGTRAEAALKRLELWEHRKKKISALSRGMAQKAQVLAATLHDPDLLLIDEPFANLDPLNAQLIKDILLDLRARGKSVIMSSHQMPLVESMCDRILLINQGQAILYGPLREVKRRFAGRDVFVIGEGDFADGLPQVAAAEHLNGRWRLTLTESATPADLFRAIAAQPDLAVEQFEVALPSLDEIFIQAVRNHA